MCDDDEDDLQTENTQLRGKDYFTAGLQFD